MSDVLPTVRVKGPKGSRIINKSDFDPKVHELADPPARDPLDHGGDGRKGGSLPAAAEAQPPVEPAAPPRPKRSKRGK
ncbi:MAG: hypothetical protein ACEQR8_04855 [Cypionkella sp.]